MRLNRHSICGFRLTITSVRFTVIGSLAISGRPILQTTDSTSGIASRHFSICVVISTEVSRDTLGNRVACRAIEPSSSFGMKTAPSSDATSTLTTKRFSEPSRIISGCSTATRSIGL